MQTYRVILEYSVEIEGEFSDLENVIFDAIRLNDELLQERVVEGVNWKAKVFLEKRLILPGIE